MNTETRRIAYGAAEIVNYSRPAMTRPGYYIVWMDEDRNMIVAPEFLTATPPTKKHGRVGNGVLMRVLHRVKSVQGWGCFAVVRSMGDTPNKVDTRDSVTAERLARNAAFMPDYMMNGRFECQTLRLGRQFFVDLILAWPDGEFISLRESGEVVMDGGSEI